MTKYTSNEQYEKDRLKIIARHSILKDMGIDIIDLLTQSEWIGAKSQMLAEIYCLADDIAQDLDYNNSNDLSRELSKAIGEAVLKGFQIKELIDIDDDQQANSMRFIRPIPVVNDEHGIPTKGYDLREWLQKLNEELDEIKQAAFIVDVSICAEYELQKRKKALAMEIQDLITVCTSYLDALGFDEAARNEITKQVNEKNRKRGYFEEGDTEDG